MESLRLAFVSDRSGPFYAGGYEYHLWQLAKALGSHHEVTVFTSVDEPEMHRDGVSFRRTSPPISYVGLRGSHGITQGALFAAAIRLNLPSLRDFDYVDIQAIPYLHVPELAKRLSRENSPWGLTVWESWYDQTPFRGFLSSLTRAPFRWLFRRCLEGSHDVRYGAEAVGEVLRDRYGVDPSRLIKVSPAINCAEYESGGEGVRTVDVCYIGRLSAYKRVDVILRAAALLRRRYPHLKVRIAGEGSQRRQLERLRRQLRVDDVVQFLGRLGEGEKRELLRSSRVFVMPSEREGFSIATLEAMASGACPVVARPSDPGAFGVRELVEDGHDALVVPCGDHQQLADVVDRILADPARETELRRRAVDRARRFDLSHLEEQYVRGLVKTLSHRTTN